jgi:hypothetical protein
MPKSPPSHTSGRAPTATRALSKRRLARILGLRDDAPSRQIDATLPHLLTQLGKRLEVARAADSSDDGEARRLQQEIADLATSNASIASSTERFHAAEDSTPRARPLGVLLGGGLVLCLSIAYATGYRIVHSTGDDIAARPTTPAVLILEGHLAGATLRVLDGDREELLFKMPADGARVELPAGRVALEVSRADCPDRWTRSVYFEEGSQHRFEPELCLGIGRLTIRSNVSQDRVRIDGLEVGSTSAQAHELGVGDHEIRVDKTGYEPFIGTVRIRPDEDIEIRAELLAGGTGGAPRGRPMPVTKQTPTSEPSSLSNSESFDFLDNRAPIATSDFGLETARLPPLEERPAYYSGAAAGSTRWHDRISADMIARYDRDASGQIDQLEESEAISCRVWRELERDFDEGGLGLSLVRYFGFDGSEWHPNALGFARAHRSAAFAKMKECGLQT